MKNKDVLPHTIKTFSLTTTLLDIINSNEEDKTDVVLAKYLIDHIYELQEKSVYDIADETFTSRSSVQRFFKRIGFDSYSKVKLSLLESIIHGKRYYQFYKQDSFVNNYNEDLISLIHEMSEFSQSEQLDHFVDLIHSSRTVVLNFSEGSTSAPYEFQEALVYLNKDIRLVTNSTINKDFLSSLTYEDTFITLSMSGNYAIATLNEVAQMDTNKVLISLNNSKILSDTYDKIITFSHNNMTYDYIQNGMQNAYTIYGFSYLFDLILNKYFTKYSD